LLCVLQAGLVEEAMTACKQVFDLDANNQDAYCDRAEAHIINEDFQEGGSRVSLGDLGPLNTRTVSFTINR